MRDIHAVDGAGQNPCGGSIARSIRKTFIACAIRALEGLFAIGRVLTRVSRGIASAAARASARVAHGILPGYRAWRTMRRAATDLRVLGMPAVVRMFTSRATVYATFTVVVLILAAQTLHARERGGFIGERPLLAMLMPGDIPEEGAEAVIGPALPPPSRRTVRAASVSVFAPTVLGAEVIATAAVPTVGATIVQPMTTETIATDRGHAGVRTHTIEAGETVASIAERSGLHPETVLWENALRASSTIQPGDTLRILPTDGVTHTVRRGETLEAIAKRYGVEAEEILEANLLVDADDIDAGDLLIIPGGRPPVIAAPSQPRIVRPAFPLPALPGKLLWPSVAGYRISQYFTWRHHGIDVAVASGTPVLAAADGIAVSSGWIRGYGYQVFVDHGDGIRTRSAHNARNLVTAGEHVTRGQPIALVGSTGRSTGPHIHFEVYANGHRVNPLQYLR